MDTKESFAKILGNASSLLVEKIILEKLSAANDCQHIAKLKGTYYRCDPETGDVQNLILVSESGVFILKDLIRIR